MLDWQTIDNAPKIGEVPILLRCPGDRICIAAWADMPLLGAGWYVQVPLLGGMGCGSDTLIQWDEDLPTHWSPIKYERPETDPASNAPEPAGGE